MKLLGPATLTAALLVSAGAALAQPSPVLGSRSPVIGVVVGSTPAVAPNGKPRTLYQVRLGADSNPGPTIEVPWSGVRPIRVGAAVYVTYSNGEPRFSGSPNSMSQTPAPANPFGVN